MTTFKHKPHFVDGAKHHLTPDAQETPPVPCDFKLGDKVTFTNDNGIAFHGHVVTGFSPTDSALKCARPHSILALSAFRRSLTNRLLFVSTTK